VNTPEFLDIEENGTPSLPSRSETLGVVSEI
jgi:hypothetical protein